MLRNLDGEPLDGPAFSYESVDLLLDPTNLKALLRGFRDPGHSWTVAARDLAGLIGEGLAVAAGAVESEDSEREAAPRTAAAPSGRGTTWAPLVRERLRCYARVSRLIAQARVEAWGHPYPLADGWSLEAAAPQDWGRPTRELAEYLERLNSRLSELLEEDIAEAAGLVARDVHFTVIAPPSDLDPQAGEGRDGWLTRISGLSPFDTGVRKELIRVPQATRRPSWPFHRIFDVFHQVYESVEIPATGRLFRLKNRCTSIAWRAGWKPTTALECAMYGPLPALWSVSQEPPKRRGPRIGPTTAILARLVIESWIDAEPEPPSPPTAGHITAFAEEHGWRYGIPVEWAGLAKKPKAVYDLLEQVRKLLSDPGRGVWRYGAGGEVEAVEWTGGRSGRARST